MRLIGSLDPPAKFRVAHPRQHSLNGKRMPRETTFQVIRAFPMAPHYRISIKEFGPKDEFYSLPPGAPVLSVLESDPTEEQVAEFLEVKPRVRVIAYRVLWDGQTELRGILGPQATAIMRMLFALGKSEYSLPEVNVAMNSHFPKFFGRPVSFPQGVFTFYRRRLVGLGLLEEVTTGADVAAAVVAANLQDVWEVR